MIERTKPRFKLDTKGNLYLLRWRWWVRVGVVTSSAIYLTAAYWEAA